jgi:hypothetical protein
MRVNDGAVAIAKPPTITDLLLNMDNLSCGTIPGGTMEAAKGCVKPPEGGFTAL